MTPLDFAEEIYEFMKDYYSIYKKINTSIIEVASNNHIKIIIEKKFDTYNDIFLRGNVLLDNEHIGQIEAQMVNNEIDYIIIILNINYNEWKDYELVKFLEIRFTYHWKEIEALIPYIKERMEFEEL